MVTCIKYIRFNETDFTSSHYKVQEVTVVCMMFCRVLVRTLHSITDSDSLLFGTVVWSIGPSFSALLGLMGSFSAVSADHVVWFLGEGFDLEANISHIPLIFQIYGSRLTVF